MSRQVSVPDWGDSGSLCQQIEIPEPGEDGYPMAELPEGDPWAPAVNRAIREIEADAGAPSVPVFGPGRIPRKGATARARGGAITKPATGHRPGANSHSRQETDERNR
jgi:hypothetical protein